MGQHMSQNNNAIQAFHLMFSKLRMENKKITKIVELGTQSGGFSVLIGLYAFMENIEFRTYDVDTNWLKCKTRGLFKSLNIDFRRADFLGDRQTISDIALFLTHDRENPNDGINLVLCDGGDKVLEFNFYSQFLKKGDIIMAHDYCKTEEEFKENYYDKIWNWHSIKDADVEQACQQYNLVPFLPEVFEPAVWLCRIKE